MLQKFLRIFLSSVLLQTSTCIVAVGSGATYAAESEVTYEPVVSNVNFDQVISLPFTASDRTIVYGDDPLQFGEVWSPVGTAPRGLIIFVHCGCWLNEFDLQYSYAMSTSLAQAGYLVWSLEYRRTGDAGGGWPGSFTDIMQAVGHIETLAGLNDLPTALLGHSAGGHLALLAGSELQGSSAEPELVIGLAAITDVVAYANGDNSCEVVTPDFMGGTPEQLPEAYSAATIVNKTLPANTWLLQGNRDAIVPALHTRLDGAGTVIMAGAGHFDWAHPGTAAFRELLALLDKQL